MGNDAIVGNPNYASLRLQEARGSEARKRNLSSTSNPIHLHCGILVCVATRPPLGLHSPTDECGGLRPLLGALLK